MCIRDRNRPTEKLINEDDDIESNEDIESQINSESEILFAYFLIECSYFVNTNGIASCYCP